MRNVSGYLTDDGKFFQDKKEAETHEKFLSMNKFIDEFIRVRYEQKWPIKDTLQAWEKYRQEAINK